MLGRNVVGYLPATVLAPVATFAGLIAYSHVLRPDEYGRAVVVLVVVDFVQIVWFQWLRLGLVRFWEAAQRDAQASELQATAFVGWFGLAVTGGSVYLLGAALWPMDAALRQAFFCGLPLLLAKSLLTQCLEWHRVRQEVGRYSLLESLQSMAGVALALLLIVAAGMDGRAIMLGGALGCLIALAADLPRVLAGLHIAAASRQTLGALLRYGLPLSLVALLGIIVNSSDRLLLQWLVGADAVGLYSLSYNLADRAITVIFMTITVPAFPLAVRAFEQSGMPAAQAQFRQTLAFLLAFAIPATAGLTVVAGPLAGAMLGPAFVASAARIVPWIAVASLMAGLKMHYFDQAFLLRHRTSLLLWTIALPAVANVGLNLWWLPRLGVMGAVYSTLAAFALGLGLSLIVGRRLFVLPVSAADALRTLSATAFMVALMLLVPLPSGGAAVFGQIAVGVAAYAAAAVLFNVVGARDRARLLVLAVARNGRGRG